MNEPTEWTALQARLEPWAQGWQTPEPNRRDVTVRSENLLTVVLVLQTEAWGYLSAITGLDPGSETDDLEILYHFCHGPLVLTVRIHQPRGRPAVPSISSVYPLAAFFERELREMFGVTIAGLNAPDHLYLPEDWPGGVFPLRKDAVLPAIPEGVAL